VIKTLNYDETSFPIRLGYCLKANIISVIGYNAISDFEKSAKEVNYYELIEKIYNPELKTKVQINMVTQPIYHTNSKMLNGGESGSKRVQHHNPNYIKRNPHSKPSSTPTAVQTQTSTLPQKGRQNHHRSKQINNHQQHPNRISPNPTINTNNHHNNKTQQQQQRHNNNRQTPPRQITNLVNMNNGQPSLVELTTDTTINPVQKNVVKHSQKPFQDTSYLIKKGQITPINGSRSSPVLAKSNRASPQGFAGSKCFEPPTPNALPKPPSNWTPFQFPSKKNLFGNIDDILTFGDMTRTGCSAEARLDNDYSVSSTARDVSQELKLILKGNA
jgi:hypothetical protein